MGVGTIPDETSEDQTTVMVPHNWTVLKDSVIPKL